MVKKSSFKYFLGYNDDDIMRSLCIKLPQMIAYVKHSDSNKTMSSNFHDSKLLKKYTGCKYKIKNTKMESLVNNDLDLMMKLTMNLILRLNLIMVNNLLKFKTVFQ